MNKKKELIWVAKLRNVSGSLGSQEQKVADFVITQPGDFMQLSITQIAEITKTSKSTVVRFCNKLGYNGLKDFKNNFNLTTQTTLPLITNSKIEWGDDYGIIKEKIFTGCIDSLLDSKDILKDEDIRKAVDLILSANNIYLYGYGGSSPNLLYFLHKLMELGLKCQAFTDTQTERLSISQLKKGDVVFAISCSGRTQTVVEAVQWALKLGIPSIAMTNRSNSPLAKASTVVLYSSGGSFQQGDFNTYSRLAQLATIDLLFAMLIQNIGKNEFIKITELHYKHTKRGDKFDE